jgi:hypothetical protein
LVERKVGSCCPKRSGKRRRPRFEKGRMGLGLGLRLGLGLGMGLGLRLGLRLGPSVLPLQTVVV